MDGVSFPDLSGDLQISKLAGDVETSSNRLVTDFTKEGDFLSCPFNYVRYLLIYFDTT